MGVESILTAGLTSASSGLSWFFPILAAALVYFQYEALDNEASPIDMPSEVLLPTYHFIVVGGGSAGMFIKKIFIDKQSLLKIFIDEQSSFFMTSGAVVASRLSEIKDWNILLLEAGGDETEISDVPLLAGYLQLSQLDWQYKTEPQDDACLGNFHLS